MISVVQSDHFSQRTMVIVGTIIAFLGLLTSIFLLDNLRLTDDQSLKESEELVNEAEKKQVKKRTLI